MASTVLATFSVLKNHVKLKISADYVSVDNIIFKLHYRLTFLILLAGSLLVCSTQFIGEHIRCVTDSGIPNHVVSTFCFFTSTFTVTKYMNLTKLREGEIAHPGVGPAGKDDDVVYHAYYQWVPFVLFFQAILFYLPHHIWRSAEGGRLKMLVSGLRLASAAMDEEIITVNGVKIPTKGEREEKLRDIRSAFLNRIHLNQHWAYYLTFCEVLNLVNVLVQMYLTNLFLGGSFFSLGFDMIRDGFNDKLDRLDEVFPKMTKCNFHKFGASGTIQKFDALCLMALNIVNEKIYLFLWCWFIFLAIVTFLGLLYRVLTMILHSRSLWFNKIVFTMACPGRFNPWQMLKVSNNYYYGDWLFLYYIAKNMDNFVFKDLLTQMAGDFEERHEKRYSPIPSDDFETLKKK